MFALQSAPGDFAALAELLLNRFELRVDGAPHRLVEVEFYLHGPEHADPFAHCDPLQAEAARWYLHRSGAGYRGGSFKGIDLTIGSEGALGGILIRSLRTPDDVLVCGPSLCVDHLLRALDQADVAGLAASLAGRDGWTEGPLWLAPVAAPTPRPVTATARVGLTLKRAAERPTMPGYLMKPYRFLTEPSLPKGRVYTALALSRQGVIHRDIHEQTGVPYHSLCSYGWWYREGLRRADLTKFQGRALKVRDLCEAHGAWAALYDPPAPAADQKA